MGFFSWIYSDTGRQIPCRRRQNTYLLVPPEFQSKYGLYIVESYYDGYGHFGFYDVYELLAEWNRQWLFEDMVEKPQRDSYGDNPDGDMWFGRALQRYEWERQLMSDYIKGAKHEDMLHAYGEDYLREIGILAENSADQKLHYPLKFVEKICQYNQAKPSKTDPKQGCN